MTYKLTTIGSTFQSSGFWFNLFHLLRTFMKTLLSRVYYHDWMKQEAIVYHHCTVTIETKPAMVSLFITLVFQGKLFSAGEHTLKYFLSYSLLSRVYKCTFILSSSCTQWSLQELITIMFERQTCPFIDFSESCHCGDSVFSLRRWLTLTDPHPDHQLCSLPLSFCFSHYFSFHSNFFFFLVTRCLFLEATGFYPRHW